MEMLNEIQQVNPRATQLIEKWDDRVKLVEDVMDSKMPYERQYTLAACLENTQLALNLLETTQSTDVGTFKKFALDLITAVVPNLIAHDIVSVQPIDNRVGMINYIKYIYGSQKGNINRGDAISSPMAHHRNEYTYSSELVESETITETSANTFTAVNLAYTPVRPGTVKITSEAPDDITDDGNGNLVGNVTSGTINYETGEMTLAVDGTCDEINVTYEFNLEYAPSTIPQVDIKIESLPVIARSRKLRALYAFDAAFDLRRSYGGDIDTLLSSQIAAEIAHEIDAEICDALLTQANAGTAFTFDKTPRSAIALTDHYDALYNKLIEGSNTIFQATRRATGNFLVVGTGAASVIETMRSFRADSVSSPVGPHKIGTVGQFAVYKNPYYPANAMLMGYRGGSYFEAGYEENKLVA